MTDHRSMPDRSDAATSLMTAVVYRRYGTPDVLEMARVPVPEIGDEDVLVRVHASSVNPLELHMLTGTPYLVRASAGVRAPKRHVLGADAAGTIVAVGSQVTDLVPGDEVYGELGGGYAEYLRAPAAHVATKPANATFAEAAAVPVAGLTALQGLRDAGGLQSGQRVLVIGASGGVGTYAVQIAKALGAHVTAVSSTRNLEMVRSLGADAVIDYTDEDFTTRDERYDVVLDTVGLRSLADLRRVLADDGVYVAVGGPKAMLRLLGRMAAMAIRSVGRGPTMRSMLAKANKEDLETLRDLIEDGSVRSVIDRTYDLGNVAEALRHQQEGHAQGKKVIVVIDDEVGPGS